MVSFVLGKKLEKDAFSSYHERGTKTSDLRIPRPDVLTTEPQRFPTKRTQCWVKVVCRKNIIFLTNLISFPQVLLTNHE